MVLQLHKITLTLLHHFCGVTGSFPFHKTIYFPESVLGIKLRLQQKQGRHVGKKHIHCCRVAQICNSLRRFYLILQQTHLLLSFLQQTDRSTSVKRQCVLLRCTSCHAVLLSAVVSRFNNKMPQIIVLDIWNNICESIINVTALFSVGTYSVYKLLNKMFLHLEFANRMYIVNRYKTLLEEMAWQLYLKIDQCHWMCARTTSILCNILPLQLVSVDFDVAVFQLSMPISKNPQQRVCGKMMPRSFPLHSITFCLSFKMVMCHILQWSSPGQEPVLAIATSKHATISVVFFSEDVRQFILGRPESFA